MRLTREKIVRISHQIVDLLVQSNEVEFIEDRDTIRQHMVQTMTNILREEEKIEIGVRRNNTCGTASPTPRCLREFLFSARRSSCGLRSRFFLPRAGCWSWFGPYAGGWCRGLR